MLDAHSGTTGRARLALTTSGGGLPPTVFVKLEPFDPRQRAFVRAGGIGANEARLYRDVAVRAADADPAASSRPRSTPTVAT